MSQGHDSNTGRQQIADSGALRALVECCPDSLFAFDTRYRLLASNAVYTDEFRHVWSVDLQPGDDIVQGVDDEAERRRVRAIFDRALRGETFVSQGWAGAQEAGRARRAYRVALSPLTNADGEITGALCHSREITRQLLAQPDGVMTEGDAITALSEAELLFQGTFENQAVGMAHVGLDGRWLRVNQKLCDIVGYPREQLLRMTFQELTHPDDLDADVEHLDKLACGELEIYDTEKRYRRSDGQVVWVHLTTSLHRDTAGRPDYCVSVVEDATERVAAREQLRQSAQMLERRVAERTAMVQQQADQLRTLAAQLTRAEQRERRRVAEALHDQLQQTLAAAKMRLSRLLSRIDGPKDQEFVEQIIHLLDDSIDASSGLALELSPPVLFDAGLLPAVHWLASHMLETHGLQVDLQQEDQAPEPAAAELRAFTFQAVRELLVNVVQHSGVTEATVILRLADDGRLQICVRDHGKGLSGINPLKRGDVGRFGLFSISQRLALLGGELTIDELETGGCVVDMLVPVEPVQRWAPALDRSVS